MAEPATGPPHHHIINHPSLDPAFPTWPFKSAVYLEERPLSNGHSSPWARLLMSLGIRRRKAAALSAANDDSDAEHALLLTDERKNYFDSSSSKWLWRSKLCVGIPLIALAFLGIIHLTNIFISLGPLLWDDSDDFLPRWGEPNYFGEGLSKYPTDFTRDVQPIPCHSHNDYWRRVPLFEAIRYGITGVEADVWLFDEDEELFVGHNTASLTPNRTFRSLYIDPLVDILDRQNPSTESANAARHGVWDESPEQTLVLLVDFKTSGEKTWPAVAEQLGPLRDRGYLTHFNGSAVVPGPVTVVATGNAPFDLVVDNTTYRDIFFDAPLAMMYEDPITPPSKKDQERLPRPLASGGKGKDQGQGTSGLDANVTADTFDATNSFYASVSFTQSIGRTFGSRLSDQQIEKIRGQIQGAQKRGLKVRYWGAPSWPIGLRNHIWEVLVTEGADMLNVDDLKAAATMDWSRKKHRNWF